MLLKNFIPNSKQAHENMKVAIGVLKNLLSLVCLYSRELPEEMRVYSE